MVQRPYLRKSVEELENILVGSWPNPEIVGYVRTELTFRDSQRAKGLLAEIDQSLGANRSEAAPEAQAAPAADHPTAQTEAARAKMAELRQRLLDLSNRNRLINFKHSNRGGRQIRIVDEWIVQLPEVLDGDKAVELLPLPPLPSEPADERNEDFSAAVEEALLTDKAYLKAAAKAQTGPEDLVEAAMAKAERALKDRVRKKLGMASRAELAEVSMADHAKQYRISPSYELTDQKPNRQRRRPHQWQTLLLEDELDRRLRSIAQQAREAREEYGIDTLHLAFGFLEWFEKTPDGVADTPTLSPLLLLPVKISEFQRQKSRAVNGTLLLGDGDLFADKPNKSFFGIEPASDEITVNLCLRERLRQDFDFTLPEWDEDLGIEGFLARVSAAIAENPGWKLRSWATLSHFAFNRLPMWLDLDPEKPGVRPPHYHEVLRELLGGRDGDSNPGAEMPPEDPEDAVPCLPMDCDSSQFAVIQDALSGDCITVQGPPGTGKSQTIANLIAALLHKGETVLFVAEKMAALEVVQSRLSKIGLSDFILELHSAKTGKKPFLDSLRKRLHLRSRGKASTGSDVAFRRKAARDRLNTYAAAINTPFGASGQTIHEIIWRDFGYRNKPVPLDLAGIKLSGVDSWSPDDVDARRTALVTHAELSDRHRQEEKDGRHPWGWVEAPGLYVDDYQRLNSLAATYLALVRKLDAWLNATSFVQQPTSAQGLAALVDAVKSLGPPPEEPNAGLWNFAAGDGAVTLAESVAAAYRAKVEAEDQIAAIAPSLLASTGDGIDRLDTLIGMVRKFLPEADGSTTPAELAGDMAGTRTKLEGAQARLLGIANLLAALRDRVFCAPEPDAADLCLVAIYLELAAQAPAGVVHKKHSLGEPGATDTVQAKLAEFDRFSVQTVELNARMRITVEGLDISQIKGHLGELERGGLFALFRSGYRAAVRFCKNSFKKCPKADRLDQVRTLETHLAQRNQLATDADLQHYAGELFTGWSTKRSDLRAICGWVDGVGKAIHGLDSRGLALRKSLMVLTTEDLELARQLTDSGLPETLRFIAHRCSSYGTTFAKIPALFEAERATIVGASSILEELGWVGNITHPRLKALRAAAAARRDTLGHLRANAQTLELLLPDPTDAVARVQRVGAMHRRLRVLPIEPAWRERLGLATSEQDWALFHQLVDALEAQLAENAAASTRVHELAVTPQSVQDRWARKPIAEVIDALDFAVSSQGALTTRAQFKASEVRVRGLDLHGIFVGASGPAMGRFNGIGELFECIYWKLLASQAVTQQPALQEFRSLSPEVARKKFKALDEQLQGLHQEELVDRLLARPVAPGIGSGLIKDRTELGLLNHIAGLEQPRTSVHNLISRAGRALQALKPCFMMSPLSVAQLIERETLTFDVVIFDEASQVKPEDAMCAMARARRFVVVGDKMQLPPTSFGDKTVVEDYDDESDEAVEEPASVESILELASSSYGDGRTLLWHYRSRDPRLIAFSNHEFYQDQLLLFPTPRRKSSTTGVQYIWVGGRYSARSNIEEARVCAQAALDFMRSTSDQSLGLVALNRPQADLIDLEFRKLSHNDAAASSYLARWEGTLEPFFVKNLENVQGDERDVIFISTVFGDDENGRFFQRFGPINSAVGHRRLNVLFTRAKHQVVLFTSLPTEKIILNEKSNRGVKALKDYLRFAETGSLETGQRTGLPADSPFEVAVRDAVEANGFRCECQVGVAGFFIDLAVHHPAFADHFMLGIECDGATYHRTPSARDRDRLRQAVLEGFGWEIYRIWSTDWFADPRNQLQKLLARLDELKGMPPRDRRQTRLDLKTRYGKPRVPMPVKEPGPDAEH